MLILNVLTSALKDKIYESDKSNSIKESLKKYTDDKELIEKKHYKKHKETTNLKTIITKKIIHLQIQTLI